jgi:hypothetical protein
VCGRHEQHCTFLALRGTALQSNASYTAHSTGSWRITAQYCRTMRIQ